MLDTVKALSCVASFSILSACALGKVDDSGRRGTTSTGSQDDGPPSTETQTQNGSSDTGQPNTDEPVDTSETGAPDTGTGSVDTGDACGLKIIEQFDVPVLPSGWTIEDGDEDGYTWEWNNATNNIGYGASAGYYWVDAGAAGDVEQRERILTGLFDKGDCTAVTLNFAHYFNYSKSEQGHVVVQRDSAEWEDVKVFSATANGSESIDLTPSLEGATSFRVGFFYDGNGSYYWKIDNIEIRGSK